MRTIHKIINGDSRQMSELTDCSVHLVVTSPPYWQLKDYGDENQIGFNDSYENYINNLNLVWADVIGCCMTIAVFVSISATSLPVPCIMVGIK